MADYADAELHETGGFAGPRLVLHTGISSLDRHPGAGRGGAVTVGWCLLGAARNVTGAAPAALPATAPEALANPDAALALEAGEDAPSEPSGVPASRSRPRRAKSSWPHHARRPPGRPESTQEPVGLLVDRAIGPHDRVAVAARQGNPLHCTHAGAGAVTRRRRRPAGL